MARAKLTKGHRLAGTLALMCVLVALLAAVWQAWFLVVAAAALLLCEILAAVLMSMHRLSGRINRASQRIERHLTKPENTYLKPLTGGAAAKASAATASKPVTTASGLPSNTVPPPSMMPAVGPEQSPFSSEAEMVRRVSLNGSVELRTHILQNRAFSLLNVLSQAAHPSHPTLNVLMETARQLRRDPGDELARGFLARCDGQILQDIADVFASARHRATALEEAITLLEAVLIVGGQSALSTRSRILLLESLVDAGQCGDVRATRDRLGLHGALDSTVLLLEANNLHPAPSVMADRIAGPWLAALNTTLSSAGEEPVEVVAGSASAFDRLTCRTRSVEREGPLVTVVVPTFEADERFDTALRSIVAQTWRNLQIVVVDDATPGGLPDVVAAWARRDSRVEIIRSETNRGTYANRNHVLRTVARGQFLTVHDDDDWSHPRKIQRQVEHLLSTGEVANLSRRVRASDDLVFHRMNNNIEYVQPNFSSLMIDVERIRANVGEWDEVNRSGDGEFLDRIAAWRGLPIPVVGQAALQFQRVREGSLTSGEVMRGYIDVRRKWYELSTRQWHAHARASLAEHPFRLLASDPRPFGVPVDLEIAPVARGSRRRVDVVIGGDFRGKGSRFEVLEREIRALQQAGLEVALMQLNSPEHSLRAGLNSRMLEISRLERVLVTSILDRVDVDALVLFDPSAVQHLEMRPETRTGGRILLASREDDENGIGGSFDLWPAINACVELFGREPTLYDDTEGFTGMLHGIDAEALRGAGALPGPAMEGSDVQC